MINVKRNDGRNVKANERITNAIHKAFQEAVAAGELDPKYIKTEKKNN